tara:strand:- start:11 stop:1717 length:1707 start_codon:yes stop_codon:yes gene_type:complete
MALTKATNRMISGAAINVLDFGAVGDGVTDDTAAIQLALNAGSWVEFPETSGAFMVSGDLQLASNHYLFGGGTITRTDSTKDIFQAIGTQGTHVKNIRVEGLRFRDETVQSGGTTGHPSMLRIGYGDDITVHNNNFYNMNALRVSVSALHGTADEEAAYASITDANMNQRISVTDNVGYCPNPTPSGSGSYFTALNYSRDFIISNNIIENYLDAIYINGGYLAAVAMTDAQCKSFKGIVSDNTCSPVRVGLWTWSARDILFDNNTIEGGTNESYDAESSINITFQNSTIKTSSGVVFSTFYNVLNLQVLNNTVEVDQTAGSAPLFNASLGNNNNGEVVMRGNVCKGTNGIANLNPAFNSHLVIEGNTFENVCIVGFAEMGMIDINNNDFIYDFAPTIEPIDLGSGILTPASTTGYRRPTINIKYNSFVNNTNANINQTCIEVGHSTVACYYNFVGNDIQDFALGINLPVGYAASGVLHTVITKDNKFDVTGNFMLIQDSSATTVSHVFTENTNGSGLGIITSTTPPSNSYYSVGSRNYFPVPTSGAHIGSVCTTAGRPGTWVNFGVTS